MEIDLPALTKTIVDDLLTLNVCHRCCLRVLNEQSLDVYKKAVEVVSEIVDKNVVLTRPCVVCLSLLDDSVLRELCDRIIDKVSSECYDCDHMTCALSLPISFQVRSKSLWFYILDKYPDYYKLKCPGVGSDKLKQENVWMSVKEVWKLLNSAQLCRNLQKILTNETNRYFFVNINLTYPDDATETGKLVEMEPSMFRDRSSQKRRYHGEILTRKSVDTVLTDLNDEKFKKYFPVPPPVPNTRVQFTSVNCLHDSIYIAGRYNKFSRYLSQTPWVVNGEKKMENSVQDIISLPINNYTKNDGITFIGSGREDVDVRTLGRGRPFVLEVSNPRTTKLNPQHFVQIENDINKSTSDVFVRDLQLARKDELHHIKMGEESKTKTYDCLCVVRVVDNPVEDVVEKIKQLNNLENLNLNQKTPIRVLHRRPLSVRMKSVMWLKSRVHNIDGNKVYFKLVLQVQAGTYIKEFVHGDFGRTKPNLNLILNEDVDILALDVIEVNLDWPPAIHNK